MPHYGGKCANLTPEEQAEKEAQGIQPVIRFRVPRNTEYKFHDMVKGGDRFESDNVGGDLSFKSAMGCQHITLQWQLMIII